MSAESVLREFVEWFDSRFPKGGKALPGVTLWSIAERAREALEPVQADGGALSSESGREPEADASNPNPETSRGNP